MGRISHEDANYSEFETLSEYDFEIFVNANLGNSSELMTYTMTQTLNITKA